MEELQKKLSKMHEIVTKMDALTSERAELKPEIITLIKKQGLEDSQFSIGDRYMRYKVDNSKSLTCGYLHQAAKAFFKEDPQTAEAFYQYAMENRPQRESETLEILKKKNTE